MDAIKNIASIVGIVHMCFSLYFNYIGDTKKATHALTWAVLMAVIAK